MIQSPNSAYLPMQPQMMPQQPANYAPVPQQYAMQQQQQPYYYNYPVASCYGQPQYNGVKIDIINPQGAAPQQPMMPAQFYPVMQQPVYPQMPGQYMPPQAATVTPYPQEPNMVNVAPNANYTQNNQQPQAPVVPEPVIQPQQQPEQPAAQTVAQPVTQPEVQQPSTNNESYAKDMAAKLNTDDLQAQASAIEDIANTIRSNPEKAPALLDTQVFDGLLQVLAKDTSAMQGPTPEQLKLRERITAGETLKPEEMQLANTMTPMEAAEQNKKYALYTIAFMQEKLVEELQKKNVPTPDIKDLPAIEQVVQTVKADKNPQLRVAGLEALAHIAKPEYKDVLSQVFDLAKNDADANVREAANKATEQLNSLK